MKEGEERGKQTWEPKTKQSPRGKKEEKVRQKNKKHWGERKGGKKAALKYYERMTVEGLN